MTMILNWRLWALAVGAVLLAAGHWKAFKMGEAQGLAKLTAYQLEVSQKTVQAFAEVQVKTETLAKSKDSLRKVKDGQIAQLNTDLADALERLRDRPERPGDGDLPSNTGAQSGPRGCTGAFLYKPDALFLTRVAEDADRLRLDLAECQAAYVKARDALK